MTQTADAIRAHDGNFLRQTIAHTIGITAGPRGTTGIHADAAVNAWWAHRLLTALTEAIPDQVPALLADISDELQMGYAFDAAREAATAAGIDVDALTDHAATRFTTKD